MRMLIGAMLLVIVTLFPTAAGIDLFAPFGGPDDDAARMSVSTAQGLSSLGALDDEVMLSESEGGSLFRFPGVAQATMRLCRTPFPRPLPLDRASVPVYLRAALKMLPEGARGVVLEGLTDNVLPDDPRPSRRVVYRYEFEGMEHRQSITFVAIGNGRQAVVEIVAREADFERVAARAEEMLRRWQETQPAEYAGGK
jgi:hypothetical protein